MSGSRKTLVRYSNDIKTAASARAHLPNLTNVKDKASEVAQVTSEREGLPSSKSAACIRRNEICQNGASVAEFKMKEATRSLNIPFDEVVYQNLIPINDISRKIKFDEISGFDGKQRRLKKLTADPVPELVNFLQPTKREFLFCDLVGKHLDLEGTNLESSNFGSHVCRGTQSNNFLVDSEGGSESEKISAYEEIDMENADAEMCCIEKFRLLHENYGLDPPQPRPYFDGSSLFKRSQAWKDIGKSHAYQRNSTLFMD